MLASGRILGDQVGSTAPVFLAFLAVHVLAGLTAVITGAVAALSRKGGPRHIHAGRWYYGAIGTVFATATALAAMHWRQDYYLFLIGAVAFTAAATGPATPAISPEWAPPTSLCSPRSTSTTAPTCPSGNACRPWRSGCSPPPSARPSSPAPSPTPAARHRHGRPASHHHPLRPT